VGLAAELAALLEVDLAHTDSSVDAFLADVDAAGMDQLQASQPKASVPRRTAQTYSTAPY
jgi:hypothetical protein